MSYKNRFDQGPKRKGYEPNLNYDHDIFNVEVNLPEYRYNNFKKCRQLSTNISERRIDNHIRVN